MKLLLNFGSIVAGLALLCVGASSATASVVTERYTVDIAVTDDTTGNTITTTGYIDTDGKTGALSKSDILAFSLTIGTHVADKLSNMSFSGSNVLEAVGSNLIFNFDGNFGPSGHSLLLFSNDGQADLILFSFGEIDDDYPVAGASHSTGSPASIAFGTNGTILTAAVPEPATWVMMILGFCGLGFLARRKRNRPLLGQLI
ncbi:PEPxxWA-CTERM sorting domain-containing protein [Bradyrhizobium sp. SK17]|nr:PEPxxWA-CTERM sorting domain-containing protein [Bradyrhizobium sp. SK17]